ncbi:hypothetical protein GLYMA_04G194550v4 [Glycine max]|nr:hypothetical protein GLYMA_04G194550v4 [Glycine max]KAH1112160.1 hypothetical protein GYH30_010472 [Glycine max]
MEAWFISLFHAFSIVGCCCLCVHEGLGNNMCMIISCFFLFLFDCILYF